MSSTGMILLVAAVVCSVAASTSGCRFNYFYDQSENICVPCSQCPSDQVVHRQCYGFQDTLCGPIPRFEFGNVEETKDVPYKPASSEAAPTSSGKDMSSEGQHTDTVLLKEENNDEKWFTITMVLVAVLVLTCIVGVVAILIFCVAYKQKQREIIREPSFTIPLTTKDDYPMMERFLIERET